MPVVTMRQLLEAGVHFGHQTRRWNPKMKRYIFAERNGIYILDLQLTMSGIERAYTFVRDLVAGGGTILFVATKKQVQDVLEEQARRCGMPYVNFRWLGGMLTNFRTMHDRIQRVRELEEMVTTGSIDGLPKKEALRLRREYDKLSRNLGGIRDLDKLPDAIYILDTKKEEIAVKEARKLGIPIVAVLDTNCDPDEVDFGIPGNDDAIRAGTLLTRIVADAVIEGKALRAPSDGHEETAAPPAPEEILPGAAAQPKAEWELQLEAEEAAAREGAAPEGGAASGDAAAAPSSADDDDATAAPSSAAADDATAVPSSAADDATAGPSSAADDDATAAPDPTAGGTPRSATPAADDGGARDDDASAPRSNS
ncbi:MAG TPA: 30S ribosomal protein S2 [Actinomycetota bacterium]|nr:30S ribosomal protein S2 [Actinomycetota bacterium]